MARDLDCNDGATRREFLAGVGAVAVVAALGGVGRGEEVATNVAGGASVAGVPWYRRVLRWGQTNIAEADVGRYDIGWWREYWKRTETQGVIVNAGGIVAYYPTKFELHYQPPELRGRDLYGELVKAAREEGLAVLARMDSSKAHEALYKAHPEWFAVDLNGKPYRNGEFYLSCINSAYYSEWLPGIMREIIERTHPEGITDNGWASTGRESICYCTNCAAGFKKFYGKELPGRRDWEDAGFRKWIEWSYARRIEQWDFNNKVTKEAGGKDCLWLGMISGDVGAMATSLRDVKAIAERSEILMLDHQSRNPAGTVGENAVAGKMLHGVLGWEKLIPESMPMYQQGRPQYRLSAKSPAEARMWMVAGFAGGIQPWWHFINAYHEDRRMYKTPGPVMKWHAATEKYLVNRRPVATVGIGWSQRNTDYFGRDNAEEMVEQPMRGWVNALVRGRIPFVPVHLDELEREGAGLAVLILPNVGAMSDEQVAAVKRFVSKGGALVASGQTSLLNEHGDARGDFALADVLGVNGGKAVAGGASRTGPRQAMHTYLRLTPELRGRVEGPRAADEPAVIFENERHPVLAGFDETDILSFGGTLSPLTVAKGAKVLATYVPPLPQFPPEDIWMRTPRTDVAGLVVNESEGRRAVYLAADLDRQFALDNFPDHGDLLANVVRWAARDTIPLRVEGAGLVNCELYRQEGRMILHVVNLTSAGTWRAPVQELIGIGPLLVRVKWEGRISRCVRLVGKGDLQVAPENGWATFMLDRVLDHEVVVMEG